MLHALALTIVDSRLARGVIALVAVLGLGTAGYVIIEGWSLLDAFYMVTITVTTVGYREVRPLSTAGMYLTIVLLFTGVGTAFYILTVLVASIIEGDLREVFGTRRMRMSIARLTEHYIVCGYGRVGQEIAVELTERKSAFVIVDSDPERLERAREKGWLVVHGDATEEETLSLAGVKVCRALLAASDSDVTNTYITLTAKGMRPDVFVVARTSTPSVERKLRQAGADRVVSPYTIGGRRMAYAALQPFVTDFIDVVSPGTAADGRILAEILVDSPSGLAGRTISEVLANARECVVLAVRDASGTLSVGPASTTRLSEGDRIMIVGDEDDLRQVGARASAGA